MCQMSIVIEENGDKRTIVENASALEVTDDGVEVRVLFDEPTRVPGMMVARIDFLDGVVTLAPRR